jgi:hypothetical protein
MTASESAPSQVTAEEVLTRVADKGFRIKVVVDTDNPGTEGHPIALHHLLVGIEESLSAAKREGAIEALEKVQRGESLWDTTIAYRASR